MNFFQIILVLSFQIISLYFVFIGVVYFTANVLKVCCTFISLLYFLLYIYINFYNYKALKNMREIKQISLECDSEKFNV